MVASLPPSRKFCFCLPVRLGVVFIALLGLVFGGFVAVAGIIQLKRNPGSKIAYTVQIVVYGLYAILSLFGIIGAIIKKRGAIKAFFVILMMHLLFSLLSGGYSIYRFFQDSKKEINTCVGGSTDPSVIKECQKAMKIMKGVLIVVFIFVWFMEIWGCIIVNNYAAQLQDEEELESNSKDFEAVRPQW